MGFPVVFLWISYFPMVFLWTSYFPMVFLRDFQWDFLWLSHGFAMDFLFSYVFPNGFPMVFPFSSVFLPIRLPEVYHLPKYHHLWAHRRSSIPLILARPVPSGASGMYKSCQDQDDPFQVSSGAFKIPKSQRKP